MNPALFSFYPKFLLSEKTGSAKTPKLQVFDETPYEDNSIDNGDVSGVIWSAKRENVSFYSNTDYDTPDVTLDPVANVKVDLPVDADDNTLYGEYDFIYKVRIANEVFTQDKTLDAPVTGETSTIDITDSDLTSALTTLVTQAGTVWVVLLDSNGNILAETAFVSNAYDTGVNTLTFDTVDLGTDSATDARLYTYYSKTVSVSYCAQDWPAGVLQVTGDCIQAQITSSDKTPYVASDTLVSRTINFNYPVNADGSAVASPESTTNAILLSGPPVYTGRYTVALTSVINRTQSDTLVLSYTIIKYNYFLMECAAGLCCMNTCIQQIFAAYKTALDSGSVNLPVLTGNMIVIEYYIQQYFVAINCGNSENASLALSSLQTYLQAIGCTCDCNETDADTDEPTIIYPLFSNPAPAYVPIAYLEGDLITLNTNVNVPTNKAVINYIAANSVPLSKIQDDNITTKTNAKIPSNLAVVEYIRAMSFDSSNSATFSGTESGTVTGRSGIIIYSPSVPIAPGEVKSIVVTANDIEATDIVLVQVLNQVSAYQAVVTTVFVNANTFTIKIQNIGSGNIDDQITFGFLANNNS